MKFFVVVLGSLTRMLLDLRWPSSITCIVTLHSTFLCFDILLLGYGYSLLLISHVLYHFSLVFSDVSVVACLYVTLYFANVSLCSLENIFHRPPQMVPGTLSMIGSSRTTCLTFHASCKHLASCQEHIVDAIQHVLVFWLENLSSPC
jgi:hypothetical protein